MRMIVGTEISEADQYFANWLKTETLLRVKVWIILLMDTI